MPPVGFEPAIPASERPQTHTLDGTATGIGKHMRQDHKNQHDISEILNLQKLQSDMYQK